MPPKQRREIPPHLRERYEKEKAEFEKKKAEFLAAESAKKQRQDAIKKQKQRQARIDVLPQPMRGLGMKTLEPSMDFLVRLAEVNNSAYAVTQQQEKIIQTIAEKERESSSSSSNPQQLLQIRKKLLSQLPDLSRLLLEVDMKFDRAWGVPSVYRGIFFFFNLFFIFLFTLIVPWSIVNARNSEVSLWAKQGAASWTRSWLPEAVGSASGGFDDESPTGDVANPFPSSSFVVAGNDGIYNVFKKLFDESNALPSSWIPVGSLVFSIGMGSISETVCPTTVAPFPSSSSSSSSSEIQKVTCMPFDISTSTGLQTSNNIIINGVVHPDRPRINIASTYEEVANAPSIGEEGDLFCLGAVCAPESFRQVGWSFPSENRYPHNPATVLKWRLAAPLNSTSWQSKEQFDATTGSRERSMFYSAENDVIPRKVSTTIECYDALSTLIKIPGDYLAIAMAEFTVFDVSSDSLIFFSLGFETQGGAGAYTGKLVVSSFSMGEDGRNIALRSFSVIFSVCLLTFTVLLPFFKIFLVRDVANCSGCHFDETMKRRPFKTVTWAKCVSCREPILVKGPETFKCEKCNAVQPAAEHHRCWRSCLVDPGWLLNFWCGLLGLFWGGADGVTLGHVENFLSLMQSQVTQFGCSFLTFRNLAHLMNLHQRGLGAIVLLLAAINAQRVFWHIAGGPIALAWLGVWRRATGIFAFLFSCIVLIAVLCSWTIGLPAYRNGATQGSITESFDPPGITFSWAQSVVWWLGRFFILAIAALGIAVVIAGGSASSRVDAAAQMMYDPDWKSLVLCWLMVVEKIKASDKKRDSDEGLPKQAREVARKAKEQQEQNENEQQDEEMKNVQEEKEVEEIVEHEEDQNENQSEPSPTSSSAKHPVDPVLDQQEKDEELFADPLTYNVDKLERCVSKLMLQLPPILEDAVDERVHFSLMEQSRMLVMEETEKERSHAVNSALQRVEEMRQQEWERQAKVLEELEDYYGDGYEDDEEEEDDYEQFSAEYEGQKSRALLFDEEENNNNNDDENVEDDGLDDYLLSPSLKKTTSKTPASFVGKGGVQLRPQSSIKINDPLDEDENLLQTDPSFSPSPSKYGRGFSSSSPTHTKKKPNAMNISDLMTANSFSSAAPQDTNNSKKKKSTGGLPRPKKSALFNRKLPRPNQQQQNTNDPSFNEFTDLHEAAQVALRNDILSQRGRPIEMEYIPAEQAYRQQQLESQQHSPSDLFYQNNSPSQQRQPSSLSSGLPISYSRNRYDDDEDYDDNNHSPNVIPRKYRSQDPQDYVVQHLLDDDEIEDVLNREHSSNSNSNPRRQQRQRQRSPNNNNNNNNNDDYYSQPRQMPSVSDYRNNNNSHSPQQQNNKSRNQIPEREREKRADELPFGRYSGLPHSKILTEPKEPIGRPFGGAPAPISLPQPSVRPTDMQPRHY